MKLNYAQIFQAAPILTKLIDTPFPVRISFSITGLIDALNPHLQDIDQYKKLISNLSSISTRPMWRWHLTAFP